MASASAAQVNALRLDLAKAVTGGMSHVDASTVPSLVGLSRWAAVNALVDVYEAHRASAYSATTGAGSHLAADSTNAVTAPVATDLGTAQTRANDLKAKANLHFVVSAAHPTVDSVSSITAANATNGATLDTLTANIAAQFAIHFGRSFGSSLLNIVNP